MSLPATEPQYRKRISSYAENAPLPKVGTRWVWELDKPHARCIIEVTEVKWNGEEWWVTTENLTADSYSQLRGRTTAWNDVGRFWEACTPIGGGMRGMVEHKAAVATESEGGAGTDRGET